MRDMRGPYFYSKCLNSSYNYLLNNFLCQQSIFLHIFIYSNPKAYKNEKNYVIDDYDQVGDAIYTFAGTEEEMQTTTNVINNLKSIAGDDLLQHNFLSEKEISQRGYDSSHVKQAAIFPKDGIFPPYLDEALETIVKDKGGQVLDHMQLKTIYVKPQANSANDLDDDVQVSKILWENTKTGEMNSTSINSLYLSLGPSMKSLTVNVPNEFQSLGLRLQNMVNSGNLMGKMMWASACKYLKKFKYYMFTFKSFSHL